jgi:hypothetical protein
VKFGCALAISQRRKAVKRHIIEHSHAFKYACTRARVNMDCDCLKSRRVRNVPESVLRKKANKTGSHQRTGLLGSMRISAGMKRVYVVAASCKKRKACNFYSAFRAPRPNDGGRLGLTTVFLAHTTCLSVPVLIASALPGSHGIRRSDGPAHPACRGRIVPSVHSVDSRGK